MSKETKAPPPYKGPPHLERVHRALWRLGETDDYIALFMKELIKQDREARAAAWEEGRRYGGIYGNGCTLGNPNPYR